MLNLVELISRDFCWRFDLEDYSTTCNCDFTDQYKYNGVQLTASVTNITTPASIFWECIENGFTNNVNFPNNGTSLEIVSPNSISTLVNNFPVNVNVKFRCTIVDAKGIMLTQEITVYKTGTSIKSNCESIIVDIVSGF
jgi:hypothetical protein